MYCEKKKCENVIKVIFGDKDTVAIQRDMEEVGIQPQLWL
jgi:hypothetical protein